MVGLWKMTIARGRRIPPLFPWGEAGAGSKGADDEQQHNTPCACWSTATLEIGPPPSPWGVLPSDALPLTPRLPPPENFMTDTRLDVLAIGNAIVDVIADADDAFLDREGLTKGSMRLIDAERRRGSMRTWRRRARSGRLGRQHRGGRRRSARGPASSARSRPTSSATSTSTICARSGSSSPPRRPISACRRRARWCW